MMVIFDNVQLVNNAMGHRNAHGTHDSKVPDMKQTNSFVTARNVLIAGAFML